PTPIWEGSETVTFTVTDRSTFTNSVNVLFSAKLNFIPPTAAPDEITVAEDETIEIDALANDQNPGGGSLRLVGLSNPSHGKAIVLPTGKALYRGATNYFGDDNFTYVIQ